MTPYNEDSLLASFKSMNIGTQLCDSSNEVNIYPPYIVMISLLNYFMASSSNNEGYDMFNSPPFT